MPPPSAASEWTSEAALSPGSFKSSWENQWYWYADIFDPFFSERQRPDGRTAMEARRNGARRTGFAKPKPAGGLRVFVVGGSMAAQYDDEDSPVRPRLGEVFSRLYPGRLVEVVYCGMPGYDSYRESLVVEEIVGHGPDLVVFMTGNNEGLPVAGKPSARVALAMQWRRLLHGPRPSLAALWRGLRPERTVSFEGRLRGMIRLVKGKGAEAVVCTLPRLYGVMPDEPLPMWDEGFRAGWAEWERGGFRAAAGHFRVYAAAHPGDLMARALLGGALERLGDVRGAHAAFHAGQDDINGTLRRVAREEGAVLADLHEAFEAVSASVPDPRNARLMRDGVHWERQADPLVSAAISRALAGRVRGGSSAAMDAGRLERDAAAWAAAAVRLHPVSTRDFLGRVMEALMESRTTAPGFSEASIAAFEHLHRRYPGELAGLDGQREALLRLESGPWAQGSDDEFERRWTAGLACLGEAYRRMGQAALAKRYFSASLARDPGAAWPRLGLALCHHAAGEKARAKAELSRIRGEEASVSAMRHYFALLGMPGKTPQAAAGRQPPSQGRPRRSPSGLDRAAGGPPCPTGDAWYWAREAAANIAAGDGRAGSRMLERAKDCALLRKDWRFMAGFYHEQGDRERARQALTTAVGEAPARWQALVDLADTAASTGERGMAASLLKRADKLEPDHGKRLSVAARLDLLGELREAERIVDELSAHDDADASVLLKGAFLALKAGRPDKSRGLLGRVEGKALDGPQQRLLGQAWSALGEPGKAREALESLARASMPEAGDVLDWAEVSARLGQAERTREPLSRIRADALDKSQQRRLAQRWIAGGELAKARRVLEGVAGADGPDAEATLERAEVEARLGHAGRARDLLSRVHEDAATALGRARVEALLGRTARAKELLAQASESNPSAEQGIQIAALCRQLGDPGRAARVLEALRKAPQQDARILVILADMHAALPAREEALGLLLRAEQSHPSEEDLHRIGLMYGRLGENRRCVAVMDRLVRARADAAAYFSDRGVCSYNLGLADAAAEDFKRAIALDPAFLPAYSSLAALRAARGELSEALRICDRALSQKARGEHRGLAAGLARTRAETAAKAGAGEAAGPAADRRH